MKDLKTFIKDKAYEIQDEIIKFRRELHENPELSYEEEETAKRVKRELEKLDLDEIRSDVGGHGVVGLLKGNKGEGKTLILRADMDALPMNEKTGLPFSSKNEGAMHACGHDVHTAMLLGACKVLTELKDEFSGNILFVFQPAEETPPKGGAQVMIDDGLLEDPKVDAAMAMHVWNYPVGKVAFRNGPMMAQSDRLFVTVKGKASHASQPDAGIDAMVGAAHIITALQTIVSRNTSPFKPLVITMGTIKGGNRYNVICDEVKLEGTVRILDEEIAETIEDRLRKLIVGIGESLGCEVDFEYVPGYTMTTNDSELFDIAMEGIGKQLGEENIMIPKNPETGGEDFSAYGRYVPTFFTWLGMESDINEGCTTLHNPTLVVDEDAIPIGIQTAVSFALEFLNKK